MVLFDANTPFLKGNTHMHTTCSDGDLSPEVAIASYAAQGYDFVVISDHRKVGPTLNQDNILVMSGAEYDFTFPDQVLHIVAVLPDAKLGEIEMPMHDHQAVIDLINTHGGVAILAHPAWSLNTTSFMQSLSGLCAAEIFNTFSGAPFNADRAESGMQLDILSTAGTLLNLAASDDSHRYKGEQHRSWTMVQAKQATPDAIIEALRAGRFYASQGPVFKSVEVLADRMVVTTSPVDRAIFSSNLPWVADRCRAGNGMTQQEYIFERGRGETFVRCEIMDAEGRRAWLSPIAL